jgi:Asp-tRNA(Asn)/Glu-tRNA(Gln) amidotransferase A subunit family amidase
MTDSSLLASSRLAAIARALRSGELDLFNYIEQVGDRLEVVDEKIQAFLPEPERRARLRRDAEILLQTYPSPESRPSLFGVPVGIKDIFRVDGFATRAGSQLPAELFAGDEAWSVQKLRKAGALVLGKTVTTEFAYFEPGPTRNPHNLKRTPGGSSSGSAAGVAAGLCPLALGTQTIGSVIRPAAFCGVVGFKPSYGRIDAAGVIYIAPSLDHVGMFTQDVAGMRLAAAVLCRDWQATEANRLPVLGVPEGAYLQQTSEEGLRAFEEQVTWLERAGYIVRRVAALDYIAEITQQHRALMAGEMVQIHRGWFAQYEAMYRPRTAEMIRTGQQIEDKALAEARKMQMQLREALKRQMDEAGVDLWICPAAKGAAPEGIESTGDPVMSFPWTFAGLPTVSIPAGVSAEGLPLGLQCIGSYMGDESVLAWAERIADTLATGR